MITFWSNQVVITGVIGSAIIFLLLGWCISHRGPPFNAIFNLLRSHITSQEIHLESMLEAIGAIIS